MALMGLSGWRSIEVKINSLEVKGHQRVFNFASEIEQFYAWLGDKLRANMHPEFRGLVRVSFDV